VQFATPSGELMRHAVRNHDHVAFRNPMFLTSLDFGARISLGAIFFASIELCEQRIESLIGLPRPKDFCESIFLDKVVDCATSINLEPPAHLPFWVDSAISLAIITTRGGAAW
jgi:hypothetical protein